MPPCPSPQDLPGIITPDAASSASARPLALIVGLSVGGALVAALLAVGLAAACKAHSRARQVRRFQRMEEEARCAA